MSALETRVGRGSEIKRCAAEMAQSATVERQAAEVHLIMLSGVDVVFDSRCDAAVAVALFLAQHPVQSSERLEGHTQQQNNREPAMRSERHGGER